MEHSGKSLHITFHHHFDAIILSKKCSAIFSYDIHQLTVCMLYHLLTLLLWFHPVKDITHHNNIDSCKPNLGLWQIIIFRRLSISIITHLIMGLSFVLFPEYVDSDRVCSLSTTTLSSADALPVYWHVISIDQNRVWSLCWIKTLRHQPLKDKKGIS